MKKNILMSVLLLLMGITVYAQEDFSKSTTTTTIVENADKYKVETNRFWSNWFVSVGGGAQMYFGDHNVQMAFGDRLSPALDIAFGKWFTPGIGVPGYVWWIVYQRGHSKRKSLYRQSL